MKALLIALFFAFTLMAEKVKLVNTTSLPAKFRLVVDDFAKTVDVAAGGFEEVSLTKDLAQKSPGKFVVISAAIYPELDICCEPQFTVKDLREHDYTATFEGSAFPFSQCDITQGISDH